MLWAFHLVSYFHKTLEHEISVQIFILKTFLHFPMNLKVDLLIKPTDVILHQQLLNNYYIVLFRFWSSHTYNSILTFVDFAFLSIKQTSNESDTNRIKFHFDSLPPNIKNCNSKNCKLSKLIQKKLKSFIPNLEMKLEFWKRHISYNVFFFYMQFGLRMSIIMALHYFLAFIELGNIFLFTIRPFFCCHFGGFLLPSMCHISVKFSNPTFFIMHHRYYNLFLHILSISVLKISLLLRCFAHCILSILFVISVLCNISPSL